MTLHDPYEANNTQFLFIQSVDFPQVLALPERRNVEGGDQMTYRFPNGYGALVTRATSEPISSAFEFCVLDCTQSEVRPTYLTPVAPHTMMGLPYEQVGELLLETERLPMHPGLESANAALIDEDF